MNINPGIFKSYDIRAIYPTEINEDNVVPIVKSIHSFFIKNHKENTPLTLVVGSDMRVSSPSLTKIATKTLLDLGTNIIDIGIVSTPTFYFAVSHYGYPAGIQITASHNPKEWNGIKMVKKGQKGLIKIGKSTGMDEIKEGALKGKFANSAGQGHIQTKTNILDDEIENSLKIAGNPKIKRFKIVADTANAMGAQYISALFKKIPMDLIKMNFELDGTFPAHQPDPLKQENLTDLQERVIKEKADFGLAPDGDGDRLFFIDEKGQTVPPTIITSIVTEELLKKYPGEQILVDIRYLLTPKKIVEENGGIMRVTKVGHAYITEAMNTTGGIFAGESSAHYFFRDTGNAESPITIILIILKALTERNIPFSELVKNYRRSYESGEFNFEVNNAKEIIESLKQKYSDGQTDTMDGIAINYPSWRFSLRSSNTEPLLRLNVEAYDKEIMEKYRDELLVFIKHAANG